MFPIPAASQHRQAGTDLSVPVLNDRQTYAGLDSVLSHASKMALDGRANELVRQTALKITRNIPIDPRTGKPDRRNFDAVAQAVYQWMRYNIAYVRDPHLQERLQDAQATLRLRSGDCDDMSILAASLLMSLGIPVRFVIIAQGQYSEFSHIYIEYEHRGKWNAFDVVLASHPGAVVQNISRRKEVMLADDVNNSNPTQTTMLPNNKSGFLNDGGATAAAIAATPSIIQGLSSLFGGSGSGGGTYPANAVVLFQDVNYQGAFTPYYSADGRQSYIGNHRIGNDKASSIKVPRGMKVTVYVDSQFRGQSRTFTEDVPNLHTLGWGDKISSIIVEGTPLDDVNASFGTQPVQQQQNPGFWGALTAGLNAWGSSNQPQQTNQQVPVRRSGGLLLPFLAVSAIGGGAWYYFKGRKKGKK